MELIEESVALLRNQPRSKVELLLMREGWQVPGTNINQDKYILRIWKMKGLDGDGAGTPSVHEIQLSAKEMVALVQASADKLNAKGKAQLG